MTRDGRLRFFKAWQHKWLICLAVSLAALVFSYWPQGLPHFRYDRLALSDGELWRLASAHLVHLNAAHLLLNVTGLFLLCEVLWRNLPARHGLGLLLSAALGISGLLWCFHPALAWYAGLSGALHGLWSGCALAGMLAGAAAAKHRQTSNNEVLGPVCHRPDEHRAAYRLDFCLGLGGLLLLLVKLVAESLHGASPDLVHMVGAPVATIAHLYGAAIGVAYVAVWRGLVICQRKKSRSIVF